MYMSHGSTRLPPCSTTTCFEFMSSCTTTTTTTIVELNSGNTNRDRDFATAATSTSTASSTSTNIASAITTTNNLLTTKKVSPALEAPVTVITSTPRTSVLVGSLFCLLLCASRGSFDCSQFNNYINIDSSYYDYSTYFDMVGVGDGEGTDAGAGAAYEYYKLVDFSTMPSLTATLEILQGYTQACRQGNADMQTDQEETISKSHSELSSSFFPKSAEPKTKTKTDDKYNLSLSTEDNHQSTQMTLHGKFQSIRATLDYTYHANYTPQRQILQDQIISTLLSKSNANITDYNTGNSCISPKNPWIVFTAGAMGSGKSYTIKQLHAYNRFPLETFITVDPDEIRRLLPEFEFYLVHNPEMAGEHTRKEAGFLAEMLTQIALKNGRNVLVDGSLKDAEWYHDYFHLLKKDYEEFGLKIGILHVTAPREAVFERARDRGKITRRIVPQHRLEETLDKVPHSVIRLAPLVDFHAELHNGQNSSDIELVSGGLTWSNFRRVWDQSCENDMDTGSTGNRKDDEQEEKELDYGMIQLLSKM